MMKFSIADLYEKKYTGEATTRMEWEKRHTGREGRVNASVKQVSGFGMARVGK